MDLKLKLIQINMYFVRDWWPCKEQAIILAYYLLLKHKQTAQKRNECLNDFCCLRLGMICITWFSSWYKVIPILCKKSLLLKTKYRLNQVCFKITSPCANTELTLNNSNCAAKKPTIQCSLAWKVKLCQNTSLRIIKEVEKLKICKKKNFSHFSPQLFLNIISVFKRLVHQNPKGCRVLCLVALHVDLLYMSNQSCFHNQL